MTKNKNPARTLDVNSDCRFEDLRTRQAGLRRRRFPAALVTAVMALSALAIAPQASAGLLVTGVLDGPLTGGVPKVIELYATTDIADLSIYGVGSAHNGGGSDGQELTLSGQAQAGDFLYVSLDTTEFENFFGFSPDFTGGAASFNGDHAIELFLDGVVVDIFGEINVDGTGEPWEYMDGWAYREDGTGPDGNVFVLDN